MQTPFRVALLVLCFALLAAVTWRWVRTQDKPAETAAADEPVAPTASAPANVARPLPPASPTAPVEGVGEMLPPDIAGLVARAESGDARAACTLGARLIACANAAMFTDPFLESMRKAEAEAEGKGDVEATNQAATLLLQATLVRRHCDGLPASLRSRAFEFTRQAALGGEAEAIVRYAAGQALAEDARQPHAFLRSPRFNTWRTEALALVESLQQAGRPEAVLVMIEATTEGSHLGLITPPDPVRDTAYRLLARRLFGEHEALRRFDVTLAINPDQVREAEALAQTWHHTQFLDKKFLLEEHTVGLMPSLAPGLWEGWPTPVESAPKCFGGGQ